MANNIAVIYARYSSHAQREESIEGQLRVCYEYAKREGFTVTEEYIDRAISGTTEERPAFQRLLADSELKTFDVVLMYSLDRFARDRYAAAVHRRALKKNGVRIIAVTQPIADSPEGIIMESLLEGMAEYYSANLARSVNRGMNENALKCLSNGGAAVLGYKVDPVTKKFLIDEDGARIVREIFDMFIEGRTYAEIITVCNERGYKTAKGKPFGHNSLHSILCNVKYKGVYRWKEIEVEGGIPAIIDSQKFEDAQRILAKNKKARARNRGEDEYYLSGKLFCGHCGHLMTGTSGTSKTGELYRYYACNSRGRCVKKNERKDVIEQAVCDYCLDVVLSDKNLEIMADLVLRAVKKSDSDGIIKQLRAMLKDVKRQEQNYLDAIGEGIRVPGVKERLEDLYKQEDDLERQIAKESAKDTLTREKILFFFERSREARADTDSFRKHVLDTFLHSVHVYDTENGGRKILLIFNASDSDSSVTLELNNPSSWTFEVSGDEFATSEKCSDFVALVDRLASYPNSIGVAVRERDYLPLVLYIFEIKK